MLSAATERCTSHLGLQATVTALADMDLFEAVGTLAISGHRYMVKAAGQHEGYQSCYRVLRIHWARVCRVPGVCCLQSCMLWCLPCGFVRYPTASQGLMPISLGQLLLLYSVEGALGTVGMMIVLQSGKWRCRAWPAMQQSRCTVVVYISAENAYSCLRHIV